MIGIEKYSYVLGKNVRTVEEIADFCTENEREQMRKIGLDKVPTDNDRVLMSMMKDAYQKIDEKADCILIAHSLPFIRTDNLDTDIDSSVPVYYISGLPCAIMHRAVEMAVQLIRNGFYKKVLVIGADKAYSDQERVFFGTIMGDGVVALLLSENASGNYIISSCISTTIYASEGENSDPDTVMEFRSKNALMMRDAINKCKQAGGIEQVDYFVTHTSNRGFWDGISALIHFPRDRFLDGNIRNTGHMNSHDSFYHYLYWCEQGVIQSGQHIMLINPGFGGTQGCTLIQR